jgi:hypothetical protein
MDGGALVAVATIPVPGLGHPSGAGSSEVKDETGFNSILGCPWAPAAAPGLTPVAVWALSSCG